MRPLIIALSFLLPTPTIANPMIGWGASTAVLHACDEADACVTVTNVLSASPEEVHDALELDGLTVIVHGFMGAGNIPDLNAVEAPLGYLVEPESAEIDEGDSLTFRIYFPALS